MEINTIIGIVIAIVICCLGLFMILRKPSDAAPSLDTELQINEQCNQPVIPRHVRSLLQNQSAEASTSERVEPSLDESKTESNISKDAQSNGTVLESTTSANTDQNQDSLTSTETKQTEVSAETSIDHANIQVASEQSLEDKVQVSDVESSSEPASASSVENETKNAESSFILNPNIQTAEIKEFEEESNILDVHLHEQQRFDDESALANAEYIISLNLYPNPRKALSGDKALKVLMKYGLRFGEMNCFHRYESPETVSPLLFSVLRITDQGPAGFDLESLSGEQVQGLAFFLALPHQNVQKGYDSMVSIAGLIARETDGTIYDENNLEFTPQLKEHWRHKAIDYRSGQEV